MSAGSARVCWTPCANFCELRSLLPDGVKLAPDDIWDRCCYVLSSKLGDPQFSGQTKERLSSREAGALSPAW